MVDFPEPFGPQESVHFTRRDVEVEAVQRAGGTEGLDEAFH